MRYISQYGNTGLLAKNGRKKYQFLNGELIIGDPTTDGTGNEIVTDFANTDYSKAMMVTHPEGTTDLEKVGLDKVFWEAPPLTGGGTVEQGKWYTVLSPVVYLHIEGASDGEEVFGVAASNVSVLGGVCCGENLLDLSAAIDPDTEEPLEGDALYAYIANGGFTAMPRGTRFKWVGLGGALDGDFSGVIALDIPAEFYSPAEHEYRCKKFKINNLSSYMDESCWDPVRWGAVTKSPLRVR